MTPTPAPPSTEKTGYSLPIIAFVLSLLGVCLCLPAIPGFILGVIALVRLSKEPHLPGKGLAIAALIIPLGTVPVTGILAAIAIPNFIKFQARAKQSECKTNLKGLFAAAKTTNEIDGHWPATFDEAHFTPQRGNRYSYFLSPTEVRPADAQRHPYVADEDHAQALAGVEFVPFTGACVGNIDNDSTLDVWTVSSTGELTHVVDDVTE